MLDVKRTPGSDDRRKRVACVHAWGVGAGLPPDLQSSQKAEQDHQHAAIRYAVDSCCIFNSLLRFCDRVLTTGRYHHLPEDAAFGAFGV